MSKKIFLFFSFAAGLTLLSVNTCFAQAKKPISTKATAVNSNKPISQRAIKKENPVRVKITTDSGILIVKLYDSTPLHRDNFLKLVKQGFYDSLLFHRVIPEFMIQGGDPQSKHAIAGDMLGGGGGDMERIPAEFRPSLIHKKGVLAGARDGNPQKASSACQFYLVEGRLLSDAELNNIEMSKGIKYTPAQRNFYKTIGGTPFLDQEYTVFGEIESGLEVISKIANVRKDGNNRPLGNIRMFMEIVN